MAKKMIKVLSIVLIAIMLISVTSLATGDVTYDDLKLNDITTGAHDNSGASKAVQNIIGSLLTIAQVVGMGVAVIMLIVLAIKYISAAPSDKAEIKKHAVVYVVGAVVLFAAAGILSIIKKFASSNIGNKID